MPQERKPNPDLSSRIKPGEVKNPKGRGKGVLNESTKNHLEALHKAGNDAIAVYNEIRSYMLEGKQWAYILWYKYYMPERIKEERRKLVMTPEQLANIDDHTRLVLQELGQFDDYSHGELVQRVRALTSIKLNDNMSEQINKPLSREELDEKVRLYNVAIENKLKEEEDANK